MTAGNTRARTGAPFVLRRSIESSASRALSRVPRILRRLPFGCGRSDPTLSASHHRAGCRSV
eukprot:3019005-Pleurochrysis_carterae.AAC.1